jgi:hypothetical protein
LSETDICQIAYGSNLTIVRFGDFSNTESLRACWLPPREQELASKIRHKSQVQKLMVRCAVRAWFIEQTTKTPFSKYSNSPIASAAPVSSLLPAQLFEPIEGFKRGARRKPVRVDRIEGYTQSVILRRNRLRPLHGKQREIGCLPG